jgi:hypothetical protein
MDKRLAKRHKRQVSRARDHVKLSEPDVRTPEQIAAARVASRPDLRGDPHPWPELPGHSGDSEKADDPQKADDSV